MTGRLNASALPASENSPLHGKAAAAARFLMITVIAFAVITPNALAKPPRVPFKPRPNTVLFSRANLPAPNTTAALNINIAGKPELSPLPVLSSEAKAAVLNFRSGRPYTSGADLAARVCSRVAVDFGPTDIVIGSTLYQGFKCAIPASGTYWANGGSHLYTVAVEVTGSAIVPPAPPAQ